MHKTYLIKGIDAPILRDFKAACAHFDLSMRRVLIKHMENVGTDYKAQVLDTTKLRISLKKKGDK